MSEININNKTKPNNISVNVRLYNRLWTMDMVRSTIISYVLVFLFTVHALVTFTPTDGLIPNKLTYRNWSSMHMNRFSQVYLLKLDLAIAQLYVLQESSTASSIA